MNLHILSDLHIEFGPFDLPETQADVLIFAGDVHTKRNGIKWIKEQAPKDIPIIYVMGNHEFYGEKHPRIIEKIKDEAAGSNIHILENEKVEIDGYTFFGCTLWSDLELISPSPIIGATAAMEMNDYKRIRSSFTYKKLSPKDTRSEHLNSVSQIRKFLDSHNPEKSIIVTHHAPSIRSLPEHRRKKPVSCAYASNLDHVIQKFEPALWIHGHIHHNQDYHIGSTRIISNPRAYIDEPNPAFDPNLTIQL